MSDLKSMAEIISAIQHADPYVKRIPVPELDNGSESAVFIRPCPSSIWDGFQREFGETPNEAPPGTKARFVAACLCDEQGTYLRPSQADVAVLMNSRPSMIENLAAECVKACLAVEDAAKNSESSPDEPGSGE